MPVGARGYGGLNWTVVGRKSKPSSHGGIRYQIHFPPFLSAPYHNRLHANQMLTRVFAALFLIIKALSLGAKIDEATPPNVVGAWAMSAPSCWWQEGATITWGFSGGNYGITLLHYRSGGRFFHAQFGLESCLFQKRKIQGCKWFPWEWNLTSGNIRSLCIPLDH